MGNTKALLIGVPRYVNKIPPLEPVLNDVNELRVALETRKFDVKSIDVDNTASTTRSSILAFLVRELQKIRGVNTLFVYFSGHGLHFRGKDYIVPSDCVVDDVHLFEETLLSIEKLLSLLYEADARTIIFFVDACREGINILPEGDGKLISALGSWGNVQIERSQGRKVIVVYSCDIGELSRFQPGKNGFSFFTKALCIVLQSFEKDASLKELLEKTQNKLNDLLAEYNKKPQKLFLLNQTSLLEEENILKRILPLKGDISNYQISDKPWHRAVFESKLWLSSFDKSDTSKEIESYITKVLDGCWSQWRVSLDAMPNDPWRNVLYPIRCVSILESLLSELAENKSLTIFEVASLLLAPFVREAIYAKGVELGSNIDPFQLEDTGCTTGLRGSFEKYCRSIPHLVGYAKSLDNKSNIADRNAIIFWILHKTLLREPLLWMPKRSDGYFSGFAFDAIYNTTQASPLVNEVFRPLRLLEFSKVMASDPERILRDDVPFVMEARRLFHVHDGETIFRDRLVAWMLVLAGYLAIDVRLLSNVLISHIGLPDPIVPANVISSLNSSKWNNFGTGKSLDFDCSHPALEFVVQEYIDAVSGVLQRIQNSVSEKKDDLQIVTNLPDRISGSSIRPMMIDGTPAYQKPFLQFRLANERVKELLMGEQLYGEPELSIRELYQNSLDALRYKNLRNKFLRKNSEWTGYIQLTQGVDLEGREYIECFDNGVGMGVREIENCFSQAGVRFHDLPEFVEEQSEWMSIDPKMRLYPNSQFGIGVFSYFMIADSITVETCRMGRDGKYGRILKISIPSSSSLFRIQEAEVGSESFTRVRLYLNRNTSEKNISCIATLSKLLWIPEYKVIIHERGRTVILDPNEVSEQLRTVTDFVRTDSPYFWWTKTPGDFGGSGMYLSDGIISAIRSGKNEPVNRDEQGNFYYLVNLSHENRPVLTIDRKEILRFDRSWSESVVENNWKSLVTWPNLTLAWMWRLQKEYPHVAERLVNQLIQTNAILRFGDFSFDRRFGRRNEPRKELMALQNLRFAISQVGSSQLDMELFKAVKDDHYYAISDHADYYYRWKLWKKNGVRVVNPWKVFGLIRFPFYALASLFSRRANFLLTPIKDFLIQNWSRILPPTDRFPSSVREKVLRLFEKFRKTPDGESDWTERTHKTSVLGLIVSAAYLFERPIGEILSWSNDVNTFYFGKKSLFSADLISELSKTFITQEDYSLLVEKLPVKKSDVLQVYSGERYYTAGTIEQINYSVSHIISKSLVTDKTISYIFQKLAPLRKLGVTLPNADLFMEVVLTDLDKYILSFNVKEVTAYHDFRTPTLMLENPEKRPARKLSSHTFSGENGATVDDALPISGAIIQLTSSRLGIPVSKIVERLSYLRLFGIQTPKLVMGKNYALSIDNAVMERVLEFATDDYIELSYLIRTSFLLKQPLYYLYRDIKQARLAGIDVVTLDEDALPRTIFTLTDMTLLAGDFKLDLTSEPWMTERISAKTILQGALITNKSVQEIVGYYETFDKLGVPMMEVNKDAIQKLILQSNEISLLVNVRYTNEDYIPVSEIIRLSVEQKMPFRRIYQILEKYSALGIRFEKIDVAACDQISFELSELEIIHQLFTKMQDFQVKGAVLSSLDIHDLSIKFDNDAYIDSEKISHVIEKLSKFGFSSNLLEHSEYERLLKDKNIRFVKQYDFSDKLLDSKITSQMLLDKALAGKTSVFNIYKQMQRFIPLGYKLPKIDLQRAKQLRPSRLGSGSFWGWNTGDRVSMLDILRVAKEKRRKLKSVHEEFQKYSILGIQVADYDPRFEALDYLRKDFHLELYTEFLGQVADDYQEYDYPIAGLLCEARKRGVSFMEIVALIADFQPFREILEKIEYSQLEKLRFDYEDYIILSNRLDAEAPWIGSKVSQIHMIQAAQRLNCSVHQIHARFQKLSPIGLELPYLFAEQIYANLEIFSRDRLFLSEKFSGYGPWIEAEVSPMHLILAAGAISETLPDALARLKRFESIGLRISNVNVDELSKIHLSAEDKKILSRNLNGFAPWISGYVKPGHILNTSKLLQIPEEKVVSRIKELGKALLFQVNQG